MDALASSQDSASPAPSPLEQYRRTQYTLQLATAEAAGGRLDDRLDVVLHANGCGNVFADRTALALAAQQEWWSRLLARCDGLLDEDISSMTPGARLAAVQQAWAATTCDLSGHLALAASATADPAFDAQQRRGGRLLALFAGRAELGDDRAAEVAGRQLIEELSSSVATIPPRRRRLWSVKGARAD